MNKDSIGRNQFRLNTKKFIKGNFKTYLQRYQKKTKTFCHFLLIFKV